ncbi:MAG: hypothetical protein AAGF95_27860 [Chloroflexota bacterium]
MSQTKPMVTVDKVVEACTLFWIGRNIPRATVNDMSGELRDHLYAATQDGKSITDVTGTDIQAFAAEWGQPYVQTPTLQNRVVSWMAQSMSLALGIACFRHLYEASLVLSIYLSDIIVLLILLLVPFPIRMITDWAPPLRQKWWQHTEIVAALITMGTIGLLAGSTFVAQQIALQPLFTWPWWLTVATLGIASLLVALTMYYDKTRPTVDDMHHNKPFSVRWILLASVGLVVGTLITVFIMPNTLWRIVPVLVTLIGGLMVWLWILYFVITCGDYQTPETK